MLYHLKKFRPLVDYRAEYRVRRGLYTAIPVRHRAKIDALIHCCAWKTGSQWVRLVLSDPRFYRETGLKPYQMAGRYEIKENPPGWTIRRGSAITAFYCDTELFDEVPKPDNYRAFYVARNPTDLLISWYYSNKYSHPQNPYIDQARAEMADMTDWEGVVHTLGQFDQMAHDMRSWAQRAASDTRCHLVKFEELTGKNAEVVWTDLLRKLEIDLPSETLKAILSTYRKENLSPSEKSVSNKYSSVSRSAFSADQKNELTGMIQQRFGDLPEALGYA